MTTNDFRRKTKQEFDDLLTYWRDIERWIKKAEQVNKKAVIPAINELRYAARQLFYAISRLRQSKLSDGEKSSISKRIIIADQYLMNADNDIIDSIISFYSKIIDVIDTEVGPSQVTHFYPGYPSLKKLVQDTQKTISDTRHDAAERKRVYREIREEALKTLIEQYDVLQDAEVRARFAVEQLRNEIARQENELAIQATKNKRLTWFSIVTGIATLASTALAFFVLFTGG